VKLKSEKKVRSGLGKAPRSHSKGICQEKRGLLKKKIRRLDHGPAGGLNLVKKKKKSAMEKVYRAERKKKGFPQVVAFHLSPIGRRKKKKRFQAEKKAAIYFKKKGGGLANLGIFA